MNIVSLPTARPRIVGKCATFFQMITLGWVLLRVDRPSYEWPLYAAGFFTLVSGIWYIFDGVKQLSMHEQMTPGEYREAWAWVHLMLHTNEDARKVLISYLRELRTTKEPGALRPRLVTVFPSPESALDRHLMRIDLSARAGVLAN